MRIDLYGTQNAEAVSSITKKNVDQAASARPEARPGSATEDKTTLSSGTDSVVSLTSAALQADPARTARVAALKQSVDSGQYKLDPSKIADALAESDV